MLDTVNPHGGGQGSLDQEQFAWLAAELTDASRAGALGCLLFSHHPWVNGHDHVNRILARPAAGERGTWWEITTASHIDWPQQARIVEVAADETGGLFIACTTLDHHGLIDPRAGALEDPLTLAGWSRELSALPASRACPGFLPVLAPCLLNGRMPGRGLLVQG